MAVCEKCWTDSKRRARRDPNKTQYNHYLDILKERKENPCALWEQRGEEEPMDSIHEKELYGEALRHVIEENAELREEPEGGAE